MKYTEAVITVPKQNLENVSNFLIINGFEEFEVYDYDDLIDATGEVFYDYIDDELLKSKDEDPQVKIYFDTSDQAKTRLEEFKILLESHCEEYSAKLELNELESEDWENNWRQYFKPFTVGRHLVVKPSWETVDDQMKEGRTVIEIDPAGAFGSGTHVTTQLCMEALEDCDIKGKKLLDMGCGSGILGICSRKIGAGFITAVDIDENAVRIAEENFIANDCKKGSFEVRCGDAVTDNTFADSIDSDFDFICANIVAGVIVSLAEFFWDKLKNDGILIASGIITERQKEVADALQRAGFTVISVSSREDWSEITCMK